MRMLLRSVPSWACEANSERLGRSSRRGRPPERWPPPPGRRAGAVAAARGALGLGRARQLGLDLAHGRRGEPDPCVEDGIAGLEPLGGLGADGGPLQRLALLVLLGLQRFLDDLGATDALDRRGDAGGRGRRAIAGRVGLVLGGRGGLLGGGSGGLGLGGGRRRVASAVASGAGASAAGASAAGASAAGASAAGASAVGSATVASASASGAASSAAAAACAGAGPPRRRSVSAEKKARRWRSAADGRRRRLRVGSVALTVGSGLGSAATPRIFGPTAGRSVSGLTAGSSAGVARQRVPRRGSFGGRSLGGGRLGGRSLSGRSFSGGASAAGASAAGASAAGASAAGASAAGASAAGASAAGASAAAAEPQQQAPQQREPRSSGRLSSGRLGAAGASARGSVGRRLGSRGRFRGRRSSPAGCRRMRFGR